MAPEMFQLVDREGNPTGQASREECHGNPLLIHLVVHLHVLDHEGRLLLQKRAMTKDTNPGRWDTSVGGHVKAGEDVHDALLREAQEELGINAAGAAFLYGYLYGGSFETEYARCYSIVHGDEDGKITPLPEEIDEVRFFSSSQINALLGTGSLTPMFEHELPRLTQRLARS